jgi:hypothetical protein
MICTDSAEYNAVALNIAHGNGIKKADGTYNFRRLPGYSLFLAACYKLFGDNPVKAILVQIILSSLIPVLIFFLSLYLFPAHLLLAKIAALWGAVHVGFLLHSGMILADSLFVFCFLLFCLLFFAQRNFFFVGILLGVCAIIRPVGHYLLILLIFMLLALRNQVGQKIKDVVLLCVGWLSIVFGWLLRNYVLTGVIFFHTLPGIHFLIYSASYVDMEVNQCCYYESKKKLMWQWNAIIAKQEKVIGRKLHDIETCNIAEKIAIKKILESPVYFLKHSVIHMCKTCIWPYGLTLLFFDSGKDGSYYDKVSFFQRIKRLLVPKVTNKLVLFFIYFELLFLFLTMIGVVGFVFLSCFNKALLYTLLHTLPFIFLFIFITLAYGCARLRLPIEPFLVIFSLYFWMVFLKTSVMKKEKSSVQK